MSEEEPKEKLDAKPAEKPEKPRKKKNKKGTKRKTINEKEGKKESEERIIEKGDFILLEMTGRAEETGEVFDTTNEETAREEGIYSDDRFYGPKMVVVGEGWVLKGLDNRLEGLRIDEIVKVEVPSEEAFGARNPDNVRMVPYRVLRSKGINPVIGTQIEVDGRSAIVRSVGAGRVQLDYNPPLAGRNIIYEIRVIEKFEGEEEKIRSLLGRRFIGIEPKIFGVKLLKKKTRITIPDEVFFAENLQIAKRGVALDIQRFFPHIDTVEFVEVIKKA